MIDFNSSFKNSYFHASNPSKTYQSLADCLDANSSTSLSPFVGSIFTRYGNRPSYPFTVFDSVYESNTSLPYEFNSSPKSIPFDLCYSEVNFSIDNYLKALRNSILTEKKNKVLFLSSGWDSTCILALLVERYGPQDITCITLRMSYDATNKETTFNPYEIKKASDFCKYFKVKHVIVDSEFSSADIDHSARLSELAEASFYNVTAYNHKTLWNAVAKLGLDSSDCLLYTSDAADD